MKRPLAALSAGLLLATTAPAPADATSTTTIYLAPHAGYGAQRGTQAQPYTSLESARDAARTKRGDVRVVLGDGSYQLDRTFALTGRDSARDGHTITYQAAPGAHPVISGGRTVTGWALADKAKGIYRAHVGGIDTRQLYVNGEAETRARGGDNPGGFSKTATGYTFTDAALRAYKRPQDLEVVSRWGWMMYRCPVASISGTAMTMAQPCWHNANLHTGVEIQNPSWLENAYELLDSPGEWYLDKGAGDLYYRPKPGQDLRTAPVTVPTVQDLVDLNGSLDEPVTGIAFEGLTFAYSTWLEPSSSDGLVEGQAGFRITGSGFPTFDSSRLYWKKTPGAVNVSYGHRISFTGNRFTHLGAVGLNLNTGTQDTRIAGNVVTDVAATGIQIGGVEVIDHHPADRRSITRNTVVSNNVVTKVASVYQGSLGILAGYTDHTTIEHNKVYDLPYSGISVGWGWGLTDQGGDTNYPDNSGVPVYTTPTTSTDTVVRDNWISDIMQHQADGGAIYTLSASPHSEVSGNLITNIPILAYGPVYHDEGSRYWHTTGNAFCDIAGQWLLLNHGLDIVADRNFTTRPQYSAQSNSVNDRITDNATIDSCAQVPASILRNAGLEPAYRHLDPDPPARDRIAPTAPGRAAITAPFPGVASLNWAAATDRTGVTGYSVYADGHLVSASTGPSARVTGLTPGRRYAFTLTARDAAGNESRPSPPAAITMPAAVDLAKGKPVTASSFSAPNLPALAVDGNAGTRWAQGLGLPDPSWIEVDLGARFHLSGVVTTFEKANGYRYRIESSNDNVRWTTVDDHTGTATAAATNYSVAVPGVVGRYLRLTVTGSNYNGGSVYELEAYGTPASSTPDTFPPTAPGRPAVTVLLPTAVDLTWPAATDNVGVTAYTVYDGATAVVTTTGTTARLTGLPARSAHSWAVVAQDADFNVSAPGPAVTSTLPAAHDLAQGKAVTASSYSQGYAPAMAVDGDLTTRWAQGPGLPDPSWIQVDLGQVTSVKGIVTTFELPSGYRYRMEYSADAKTWSTFEDHTKAPTTDRISYSLRGTAVDARYLRLTVTGSNFNGGSIYELQAFGGF